jgi:lipase chaperone LimK
MEKKRSCHRMHSEIWSKVSSLSIMETLRPSKIQEKRTIIRKSKVTKVKEAQLQVAGTGR